MAASGNPVSLSFTPAVAGTLIVTVTFDASASGSDWGAGASAKVFCTQNGVTTYGDTQPIGAGRTKYTLQYTFTIAADLLVTAGLWGGVSGAASMSFYNLDALAEHIKK